jgi:hypothetical protein
MFLPPRQADWYGEKNYRSFAITDSKIENPESLT